MVVLGNCPNRAELRKKPRRNFHYNARILTDKAGTMLSCLISDISETGARLVLEEDCELPEEFVLLLTPTGEARRHCSVMWRTGTSVGVAFPEPNP
jgi:PilZ domain